jgi:hypothetical protein
LNFSDEEFFELHKSLTDLYYEPPLLKNKDKYKPIIASYDFGWELGLQCKIVPLLSKKNWIEFANCWEEEKIRRELKTLEKTFKHYIFLNV